FFFQAEDGIRDLTVTGVQTCALPICITERYILRDFGNPSFSVLLISNTALKPERGNSYEVGFKAQRDRWLGSFAYFRNNLEDFLRPAFSNALFVPADPVRGLQPISPDFPFHG